VPDEEDYTLQEDVFESMARAFRALSKECRSLLHEFYHNRRSLQELAEDEATNYPSLRKQKSRCVQHMRLLFTAAN
jgi:DNA-directed RNA polymerase specialized sigma24 family protein